MNLEKVRKLSKHPSYKKDPVPCILIAGKEIAKKYDWHVGDHVIVRLEEDGVKIKKAEEQERQDEIQEDTTSMEEKAEELNKKEKDEPKEKQPKTSGS